MTMKEWFERIKLFREIDLEKLRALKDGRAHVHFNPTRKKKAKGEVKNASSIGFVPSENNEGSIKE